MNKRLILQLMIMFFFLMYVLLSIKFYNGFISNLQIYSSVNLIPMMFWVFIIILCIYMLTTDIGFMKIGVFLGIITGVLILIFQGVNTTSKYEEIHSVKYKLILEKIESPDPRRIIVYKKVSPFFSEIVDNIQIQEHYELFYEIVGDNFVITKCSNTSCITVDVNLE